MDISKEIKIGKTNGFTLAEILISIGLFATIAIVAGSIFTDLSQLEKKSSVRDSFYTAISIVLQQITNEIQNGTVDYEEYFNMDVIESEFYGINYGAYASRFYDPGQSLDKLPTTNPEDLGTECSYPNDITVSKDCKTYYNNSTDSDAGQNPYSATDDTSQKFANAFCDTKNTACGTTAKVNELYLIDSTGTKKTIIGKKLMNTSGTDKNYAIGIVRMYGRDLDQNGLVDIFSCTEEFTCTSAISETSTIFNAIQYSFIQNDHAAGEKILKDSNVSLPKKSDLEAAFDANTSNFMPISPSSITIKDLKFMINPVEDPYKATAEPSAQMHPSVTIFMKLGLSSSADAAYPGDFGDVEVQTTVSAGTMGGIESYPSVDDVLSLSNKGSWIKNVLPGTVN
jgi:type II secretory pathway pseudopilin PulG